MKQEVLKPTLGKRGESGRKGRRKVVQWEVELMGGVVVHRAHDVKNAETGRVNPLPLLNLDLSNTLERKEGVRHERKENGFEKFNTVVSQVLFLENTKTELARKTKK